MARYVWPVSIFALLALALVCVFAIAQYPKHDRMITYVAASRDGRWIAGGTCCGTIMVCEASASGGCRSLTLGHGILNDLQISPDDRFLAAANEDINLFALDRPKLSYALRSDQRNYGTIEFNKTGTELLTITGQGTIERIGLPARTTLQTICCSTPYGGIAFSSDEKLIFSAGHWPRVWDRSGHLVRSLNGNPADRDLGSYCNRPGVVPDSDRFARRADVYMESSQHTLLARSDPLKGYVTTIAILPGLHHSIAYAGVRTATRVWDYTTGAESEYSHLRPTSNLVALPDGHSILFGTDTGTVEIWDLARTPVRRRIVTCSTNPRLVCSERVRANSGELAFTRTSRVCGLTGRPVNCSYVILRRDKP